MAVHVYVGAYTSRGAEGISHFLLEGERLMLESVIPCTDPSYLCVAGGFHTLLAVEETAGPQGGKLRCFTIDETGAPTPMPEEAAHHTLGDHPCHVALSLHAPLAAVANYSGGSFSLYRLNEKMQPAGRVQTVQHQGGGVDPARQEAPHVHCMVFHPDGKRLYAVDLGLDRCACYLVQPDGTCQPAPEDDLITPVPGTGFRHMVIHPNGRIAYVNGEMGNTLSWFRLGKSGTVPLHLGTLSTLSPEEQPLTSYTAAIRLHPNHRFLYVSNRGADVIAVYRLSDDGQVASFCGTFPAGGKCPRDFHIWDDLMLVAHQDSDTIALFRVDERTGMGTLLRTVSTPAPVCIECASF